MKRVFGYLSLFITFLSLSGTAQAVPEAGNLLFSSADYSTVLRNEASDMTRWGISWNFVGVPDTLLFADCLGLQPGGGTLDVALNSGVRPYYSTFMNDCEDDLAEKPMNEEYPNGVPEPDTMMMLGSGLLVLAGIGRRFTRT